MYVCLYVYCNKASRKRVTENSHIRNINTCDPAWKNQANVHKIHIATYSY